LHLLDSAGSDPWGIGADGAEFTLATTVDTAAQDRNTTQVQFASFLAIGAKLWLNGTEVPFVNEAYVDFADYAADPYIDIVTMGGTFAKGGEPVDIESVVGISPLTFTFANASESPPIFSATQTTGPGTASSQPYYARAEGGVTVTAVPETSSLKMLVVLPLAIAISKSKSFSSPSNKAQVAA
jgi:hypothetical protein